MNNQDSNQHAPNLSKAYTTGRALTYMSAPLLFLELCVLAEINDNPKMSSALAAQLDKRYEEYLNTESACPHYLEALPERTDCDEAEKYRHGGMCAQPLRPLSDIEDAIKECRLSFDEFVQEELRDPYAGPDIEYSAKERRIIGYCGTVASTIPPAMLGTGVLLLGASHFRRRRNRQKKP
jgi:hypothetical protein